LHPCPAALRRTLTVTITLVTFASGAATEPLPRETYGRPADRGIAGLRLAAKSPPSLAAMVSRWEAGEAEIYLLTPRPDVLARGE
jgi:hypothetical protein